MGRFEFIDDGRTFTCERDSSPATPGTQWWWLRVSGDALRYAAFTAKASDTQASVKPRMIAYYTQILADRARPPAPRSPWGRRPSTGTPAAAAAPAAEQAPGT
jgi:hypothetical protein